MAIAAVIGLALFSTVSSSQPAAAPTAPNADFVAVDVSVDGMSFVPASVDVPAGKALRVNFTNTGDQVHDLKIGDVETGRVNPGDTVVLDTEPLTESIEGYCTIAGHKLHGMVFQVNVLDGDQSDEQGGTAAHGHGEGTAASGGGNPLVDVPTQAQRTAPREGFAAFDAALAPATAGVHEHRWVMTEEVQEVAPGVEQQRWLFNGQAPAPTLRGKVGDTFRITIVNEGSMGHSIDFHAGEVSPDDTMKTIDPGEELTYEFTANRAGIWMYHCSTAPMSLHIANGMTGAVIIDPQGPDALADVDGEYAFIASDIFLGSADVGADPERVASGQYDLMAFNFYPNQYDLDPIEAKVGQTLRLWVLNVGPDQPLSFHVVGGQFHTVYKEGAYLLRDAKDAGSQALSLLPAEGGFVELTFTEPGTYSFVNHIMTSAEKGQHGKIVVS
ncbi:membrane protein [Corynebacterium phocae]|uniref:Copper-containing nitrite reductase n=1 Tax=Corynebacterium phocae TaxID=161895 RepID=A0A1L7D701_9CORY|nr:membrane protein [Corynebacterium phocae]